MVTFIIWLLITLVFAGAFLDIFEDKIVSYAVKRDSRIRRGERL